MVKIIAFHLPQFHEIPENDLWWGKGFTEWTNSKKARPIYSGHYQPKEPLNDYYYNLLNKSALQWQVDLAKRYGIYGFCFYHYWFLGKQLLEKPIEIYLNSKELDLPFCFSWANHSWTRTWLEKDDILLEIKYGDEEDWKNHFYYLLPYFKDDRYIKMENMPVMIFNRPVNFNRSNEMVTYWSKLAIENGLDGIYFIETLSVFQTGSVLENSNALMESHPSYTKKLIPYWYEIIQKIVETALLKKLIFKNSKPIFKSYDYYWKKLLETKPIKSKKRIFPGAFVNWDNTARRPTFGVIFLFFSVSKFKRYLKRQITRCKTEYGTEYLFLNAWNEWAEGNYLEPDKKHGFQMLEAVKSALEESATE